MQRPIKGLIVHTGRGARPASSRAGAQRAGRRSTRSGAISALPGALAARTWCTRRCARCSARPRCRPARYNTPGLPAVRLRAGARRCRAATRSDDRGGRQPRGCARTCRCRPTFMTAAAGPRDRRDGAVRRELRRRRCASSRSAALGAASCAAAPTCSTPASSALVTLHGESSIGSGVRRVEALVGVDALRYLARSARSSAELTEPLKVRPEELPERVAAIVDPRSRTPRASSSAPRREQVLAAARQPRRAGPRRQRRDLPRPRRGRGRRRRRAHPGARRARPARRRAPERRRDHRRGQGPPGRRRGDQRAGARRAASGPASWCGWRPRRSAAAAAARTTSPRAAARTRRRSARRSPPSSGASGSSPADAGRRARARCAPRRRRGHRCASGSPRATPTASSRPRWRPCRARPRASRPPATPTSRRSPRWCRSTRPSRWSSGCPARSPVTKGPPRPRARKYAAVVAARIAPVPVRLVDERLTSVDAHRTLRESGVAGQATARGGRPGRRRADPADGPRHRAQHRRPSRGAGRTRTAQAPDEGREAVTQQHDFTETIFGEPPPPARRRRDRHRHRPPRRSKPPLAGPRCSRSCSSAVPATRRTACSRRWRPGCSPPAEADDFAGPGQGEVDVVVEPGQTGEDIATTLRDAGVVKSRSAYLEVAAGDPEAGRRHPARHLRADEGDAGRRTPSTSWPTPPTATSTARRSARGCGRARPSRCCRSRPASRSRSTSRPPRTPRRSACPRGQGQRRGLPVPVDATSSPRSPRPPSSSRRWSRRPSRCSTRPGSRAKDRQKVLTLASLVEAEAKLDATGRRSPGSSSTGSRPTGAPAYGLLQSDAAVSYGAQRRVAVPDQGRARATRATPTTPTSTRACRPGRSATRARPRSTAAANPADGPWFFFVAVNPITGETKYADDARPSTTPTWPSCNAYCEAKPQDCGAVRAAVLGSPIAHSLSPALHRAGYAAAGLTDWEYDAHEVDADGLAGFVAGLGDEWRGLSLTMPLKEVAARRRHHGGCRGRAGPAPPTPWCAATTAAGTPRTPTSSGVVAALARAPARRRRRGRSCSAPGATARSAVLALAELGRHHAHRAGPRHRPGRRPAGLGARPGHRHPQRVGRRARAVGHAPATTSSCRRCPGRRGRRRGGDRARGAPRHPARRRLRRVADAAGRAAAQAGMTVVSRPRHARAPGRRAVPAVHRARRPARGDGRRGARGAGAGVTPRAGSSPSRPWSWAWWGTSPGDSSRPAATGSTRTRPSTRPGRNWWPGLATAGAGRRSPAWSVGDLGGWAALPAYLLFAWLTVGLVWIDLDVHRLPVGLVVPTGVRRLVALLAVGVGRHLATGAGCGALVGAAGDGRRSTCCSPCCPAGEWAAATCGSRRSSAALLGWLGRGPARRGAAGAASCSAACAAVALLVLRRVGAAQLDRLRPGDVRSGPGWPSGSRPGS